MPVHEIESSFSASTAFAITLASLASSTAGVGRQSDMVDNTTTRYGRVLVYLKITQGTNPATGGVSVYLLRGDNHATPHRADGAGASDAALTVLNARLIGYFVNDAAPATGEVIYGECVIDEPGPKFGVCIVQSTTVNLNAVEANHWVRYVGINPEIQ